MFFESEGSRFQRKCSVFFTKDDSYKQRKASPAIQFDWLLEKDDKVEHLYGNFKGFDKRLIFHFDNITLPEDKLPYHRCRFLRLMSVLPEERGKGLAKRFLKLCTRKAEKTGCLLYAQANPFELKWDWCDYKKKNIDKLKKAGKYLTDSTLMLEDYYFWTNKVKEKRKRQKKRFIETGWEPINCNYDYVCKIEKRKHARWTFCYVPSTIDREFFKQIKWRLPKRRKG